MFCGVVNLVTNSIQSQTKANVVINVLGGAELLGLIGTRMLFRLKELGESWTEDGVIFSET